MPSPVCALQFFHESCVCFSRSVHLCFLSSGDHCVPNVTSINFLARYTASISDPLVRQMKSPALLNIVFLFCVCSLFAQYPATLLAQQSQAPPKRLPEINMQRPRLPGSPPPPEPRQPGSERPTPFGLHVGMSLAQVTTAVGGEKNIKEVKNQWYGLTVPVETDFTDIFATISPETGLCKIAAMVTFPANQSGDQVRLKFSGVRNLLVAKYGEPNKEYDFLHVGALYHDENEFMWSLYKEERTLAMDWVLKGGDSIMLEAKALDQRTGLIVLSYEYQPEFDKWKAQRDKQRQGAL